MNTYPSHQDQPAQAARRPRRRTLRSAVAAAAVLAGAGGLMLAASGIASASVDQTTSQYAEIGPLGYTGDQSSQVTAVYTIQNAAESGTEMLEDNDNNMNSGGTVDVWTKYNQGNYQDPMGTGPYGLITQANYLWEYVPDNPSDGGSIVDGPGELINRQSGLCLDVANNDTGDGAAIDQWTCNGGSNQQWTALDIDGNGNFTLQPLLDKVTGFLGVGNGSTCTTNGDGDSVYARATGTTDNPCDEWDIQQASYDFATYAMTGLTVTDYNYDNRTYQCVTGDTVRFNPGWDNGEESPWDYYDLSTDGVVANFDGDDSQTSYVYKDAINYGGDSPPGVVRAAQDAVHPDGDGPSGATGQVIFYCDPPSTTP
jgi:hypothetical protein